MVMRYYFDTSIWLDFFEERNVSHLPKSDIVNELIHNIVNEANIIIYSNAILDELVKLGYGEQEINTLLYELKNYLLFVEFTDKQFGKAKDLSIKRDVPLLDALHALIARDNKCIMVTRDAHFKKLLDIIKAHKPEELT
jgi:predicted nucleic acid-binding protein